MNVISRPSKNDRKDLTNQSTKLEKIITVKIAQFTSLVSSFLSLSSVATWLKTRKETWLSLRNELLETQIYWNSRCSIVCEDLENCKKC